MYHLIRTGVKYMKQQPCDRAIVLGEYILENNATVRAAAAWFGISKSTVHKDVSQKLSELSPSLYRDVKEILAKNKQERHIRGGMATKKKYERLAAMNHRKENETRQQ
jgi:putative DeoR family transcriptional regulator (stage III sporulation protein D)